MTNPLLAIYERYAGGEQVVQLCIVLKTLQMVHLKMPGCADADKKAQKEGVTPKRENSLSQIIDAKKADGDPICSAPDGAELAARDVGSIKQERSDAGGGGEAGEVGQKHGASTSGVKAEGQPAWQTIKAEAPQSSAIAEGENPRC